MRVTFLVRLLAGAVTGQLRGNNPSNGKRRTTWLGAYIKPPGYPRADRMQGLTEERKEDGKTKYGRTKTDYDGRRGG